MKCFHTNVEDSMKQKKKHFKKQLLKKIVEYPEAKMKMEQKNQRNQQNSLPCGCLVLGSYGFC